MASRRNHNNNQIDCTTCQAQLAEYIAHELNNEPVDQLFPTLTFHIETCAACQSRYFSGFRTQGLRKTLPELQQIGRHAAVSATLGQIAKSAAKPIDEADADWVKTALNYGHVWIDAKKKRWQQLRIALHRLLVEPTDSAAFALGGLQSLATAQPDAAIHTAQIEYADGDLIVHLAVESVSSTTETDEYQLVVTITSTDHWDRLPEFQVELRHDQTSLLEEPDEFGSVVFTPVPSNVLESGTLTIRPPL